MNLAISELDRERIRFVIGYLMTTCYQASAAKGFWKDYEAMRTLLSERAPAYVKPLEGMMFGQKIALIHSELSEGLEGNRKDSPSDKIPGFSAEEEELVDTLVRIFDLAGRQGLRLGEALIAKLDYNYGRPQMHGGKLY